MIGGRKILRFCHGLKKEFLDLKLSPRRLRRYVSSAGTPKKKFSGQTQTQFISFTKIPGTGDSAPTATAEAVASPDLSKSSVSKLKMLFLKKVKTIKKCQSQKKIKSWLIIILFIFSLYFDIRADSNEHTAWKSLSEQIANISFTMLKHNYY